MPQFSYHNGSRQLGQLLELDGKTQTNSPEPTQSVGPREPGGAKK
jgi:hypothetical protein